MARDCSENKIQLALAQFIRSIQSFDSKYDAGRALAANDNPLLILQHRKIKEKFVLTAPIFLTQQETELPEV
jgi:cytochrome c peroxidase